MRMLPGRISGRMSTARSYNIYHRYEYIDLFFHKEWLIFRIRFLRVSPQEIVIPSVVLYKLVYGIAKSTSPRKRQAQLKSRFARIWKSKARR